MSRNYVDENGNLIQIAGKGVGVAEWGTPIENWLNGHTTSATSITADCDGVFVASFERSASFHFVLYDVTENKQYKQMCNGGTAVSFSAPIKKGHKYYKENISYTSYAEYFYPFKTNNNLQMVREKYSTDETVIGEWIDGKPLYRKVIMGNATQYYNVPELNIKDLIYTDGFFDNRESTYQDCLMFNSDAKNNAYFVYQENNKRFYIPVLYDKLKYIIIEYTKTTD